MDSKGGKKIVDQNKNTKATTPPGFVNNGQPVATNQVIPNNVASTTATTTPTQPVKKHHYCLYSGLTGLVILIIFVTLAQFGFSPFGFFGSGSDYTPPVSTNVSSNTAASTNTTTPTTTTTTPKTTPKKTPTSTTGTTKEDPISEPSQVATTPTAEGPRTSFSRQEEIDYFIQIAIKSPEFDNSPYPLIRWTVSKANFKVVGNSTPAADKCINDTISTINSLISSFKIQRIYDNSRTDITLNLVPNAQIVAEGHEGGGYIYHATSNGNILSANIYAALDRWPDDEVVTCHLLRHEITHSLGLRFNGYMIHYSIFDVPTDLTAEYLNIDKDLIKMMYNTGIGININEAQARAFLATANW